MKCSLRGFKRFVEMDMDPSPEKARDVAKGKGDEDSNCGKEDYLAALGDEEGMEWSDIVNALQSDPWISTHFALGKPEVLYKKSAWRIVPGTLTPHGAAITLMPQKGDRSYLHGNRLNKSKYHDKNKYWLNRQELIAFLTKGWEPAVQQAQQGGGAGGGMPGMDPTGGGGAPGQPGAPPMG
jgi:hypothetical protein